MKYRMIITLLFPTLFLSCSKSTEPAYDLNNDQFEFILYDGLKASQIINVKAALGNNNRRITNDLEVQTMPKVTVKIWSDYDNFMQAMEDDIGTRYVGAAEYIYSISEFRIFYNQQVAVAAVHEFAHLVSMQINSSIVNNPRWLWEAVALYENNEFVDPKTLSYMMSGNYPTLDELNANYNSGFQYIYSVGYILLEYIVHTWGMDTVIQLIQKNGNVTRVLGLTVQEFEAGWYEFVEQKYLN